MCSSSGEAARLAPDADDPGRPGAHVALSVYPVRARVQIRCVLDIAPRLRHIAE